MTEQPDYIYFECPECGFSSVQKSDFKGSEACPLCAGDSGHDVCMNSRTARDTDRPEGKDARKSANDASLFENALELGILKKG